MQLGVDEALGGAGGGGAVAAGADCHAARSPLRPAAAEEGHEASREPYWQRAQRTPGGHSQGGPAGSGAGGWQQGAFVAELVPLAGATHARLWAAAAGAEHAPWLCARLPALHRVRLPADRCALKLALALL